MLVTRYGDYISENEMGTTCSTHWGDKQWIEIFSLEDVEGRDIWGVVGVDGRMLMGLTEIGWEGVDWI